MKKLFAFILLLVMVFSLFSCSKNENEKTKAVKLYENMGDADGNGIVDNEDLDLFSAYLDREADVICFENLDLNADGFVDEDDLSILDCYLQGKEVKIENYSFSRENVDVSDKLKDLGINGISVWNDSSVKNIVSRNPYDMVVLGDRVLVSGGNYNDNTGPVTIYSYKKNSQTGKACGSLKTEQIDRFYKENGFVYTFAIDPRGSGYGEVYRIGEDEDYFQSYSNIMPNNTHLYDTVVFHGKTFFCGQNDKYVLYEGYNVSVSKAHIYMLDSMLLKTTKKADFISVDIYDKQGNKFDYNSRLQLVTQGDYTGVFTGGLPRLYEFLVINDTLYVYYSNSSTSVDDKGFYRYDEENNRFVYADDKSDAEFYNIFKRRGYELQEIQHDFNFNNQYYVINWGMFRTSDLNSFEEIKINEYEDYTIVDTIFIGDKAYVLAYYNDNGTYINIVAETSDFNSFRVIFHFKTKTFARSFEYVNGDFYFGLGTKNKYIGSISELDENATECGRILKYTYYYN